MAIKALVPQVTKVTVITEENDPNDLLGRPNGYSSAATLFDKRVHGKNLGVVRGASIEVFPSDDAALARFDYIDGIQADMPLIHDYMMLTGNALLRISGDLKPSQFEAYREAFTTVMGQEPELSNV